MDHVDGCHRLGAASTAARRSNRPRILPYILPHFIWKCNTRIETFWIYPNYLGNLSGEGKRQSVWAFWRGNWVRRRLRPTTRQNKKHLLAQVLLVCLKRVKRCLNKGKTNKRRLFWLCVPVRQIGIRLFQYLIGTIIQISIDHIHFIIIKRKNLCWSCVTISLHQLTIRTISYHIQRIGVPFNDFSN